MIKNLVIIVLSILLYFSNSSKGISKEQNQYCNIETTLIKTINEKGELVKEETEEKVVCNDGVKHILKEAGIADSCSFYTYQIPIGGKLVDKRSLACQKLDGGYEIVPGFSGIN